MVSPLGLLAKSVIPEIVFSRHVALADGVSVDSQKVEAIVNWERPASATKKEYVTYCDTSRQGLGCVLMNEEYHPGKANVVADALSRQSRLLKSELCGIRVTLLKDSNLQKMLEKSKQGSYVEFEFRADGAIVNQGRLCIPSIRELKDVVLEEAHSSAYAIHPGSTKMYRTLKKTY
ncbi:Retrotransposable element Tf2 [Cucumis melo var. makuwa]|uniref:Retrotransposable element Tf2 n=1 Tax=Cucumis melo var. makuwa TaxID=1194695 RepID=A0A5D3E552_CUCMM|nr:Retrotransposable element Tf2 [Cucumis melo var. makuwa]TYK30999.1 Retrotransposable element Tf2 [Cucumis melo var. makuwa]